MAKPTAQQCHALTTYYIKQFTDVVGFAPVVNRNKARYGFEGLLMDYSPEDSRKIIDYYLAHYANPSVDWFIYNYEKVVVAMEEYIENEEAQQKRREATAKRLEEWRNRWKK